MTTMGLGRASLVTLGWATLGLAAVGLTACEPPHPHWRDHWGAHGALKTISTLDCPDTQGGLTRKSMAADGKTCVYASESGAQVTLQLISLGGQDAKTALSPLEAALRAELPVPPAGSAGMATSTSVDKDRVDINLPGIHIHANGNGHADVGAAGVQMHADDRGAHVESSASSAGSSDGVSIDANDAGAQIRVNQNGAGTHMSYILASETPGPHGYRMAGYEARGPSGGPLAVASVLSKDREGHDDLRHDARALLRRNVGG